MIVLGLIAALIGAALLGRGTRFLLWTPLAVYVLLIFADFFFANLGFETALLWMEISAVGSFVIFFYISYLALWKARRTATQRVALAAVLPLAPLVLLAMLDFAGVVMMTIPQAHGLPLPNISFWLWPGIEMSRPLENIAPKKPPPEPTNAGQIYVRGGIEQPDGSLILYGATAVGDDIWVESESKKLLARLDAEGNVDKSFKPVALESWGLIDMYTQPDGTVLTYYEDNRSRQPVISQMSPNGSMREIARVLGYEHDDLQLKIGPQHTVAPLQILPGWVGLKPKLRRLLPDGRFDEPFNAQAAKVIDEQHLGSYWLGAVDPQGRTIAVLMGGILRLDAKGLLLPPGAVGFDKDRVGDQEFMEPTGLAIHPNGSIFVCAGHEWLDKYLPRLMRFDNSLREDHSFSRAVASVAAGVGDFHVLGFRRDGGVIVSFVQKMHGSRILYLGPQGELIREVHLEPSSVKM